MKEITFITNIPFCPLHITHNHYTQKYKCNINGKLTIKLKSFCIYKISSPQNGIIIYINQNIPSTIYLQSSCNQIKKQQIRVFLTDHHYFGLPIKKGMIIFEN